MTQARRLDELAAEVLYRGTILGDRFIIHSGGVLGRDGFGYASHRGAVPEGLQVAGIPAVEAAARRRQQAMVSRLEDLRRRVKQLERLAGASTAPAAEPEEGT